MAESEYLYAEVLRLSQEVAEIKHTTNAQVRFNKELKDTVVEQLKKDDALIAVFLAIDGARSQKDIITFLESENQPNTKKSTVSNKINELRDLDLIEPIGKAPGTSSIIYKHTNFAKITGLPRTLSKFKKNP